MVLSIIRVGRLVPEWISLAFLVAPGIILKGRNIAQRIGFSELVVVIVIGIDSCISYRIGRAQDVAVIVILVHSSIPQPVIDHFLPGIHVMGILNPIAIGINVGNQPTGVIVNISSRRNASWIRYFYQAMRRVVTILGRISLLISSGYQVAPEIILVTKRPAIGICNLGDAVLVKNLNHEIEYELSKK